MSAWWLVMMGGDEGVEREREKRMCNSRLISFSVNFGLLSPTSVVESRTTLSARREGLVVAILICCLSLVGWVG